MELGSTVTLTYRGTLDDGTQFGYATKEQPMVFQTGLDLVIEGLEKEILQMQVGERRTFTVDCYQAYGEYRDDFEEVVPLENIPFGVSAGKRIWMFDENGSKFPALVTSIEGGRAHIDMNHPLAGRDLTFDVEILSIEEPPGDFVSAAEQRRRMGEMSSSEDDHGLSVSDFR